MEVITPMSLSVVPPAYFEVEALLARVDQDTEFLEELLSTFFSEVPPMLEQLQAAIAANDAVLVGQVAHGLKGMCLNMEAKTLHPLAYQLEQCGKQQFNTPPQPILDEVNKAFDQLKQAMPTLAMPVN